MSFEKFPAEEQGTVTVEYVIFVAAIGIIMAVGVYALFNGMSALFNNWASYFQGGS